MGNLPWPNRRKRTLQRQKLIKNDGIKLPVRYSDKKSAEQTTTTTISVNERLCEDYFCKKLGEIGGKDDISRLLQNDKVFISYAWEETALTKRHATDLASYLKLSGFKTVIYDGDNGGSDTLPGLLEHLETSNKIIVLVTSTLNQKLNDLANTHVIRDEINIITKKLVDTEWKGQIIPILLQGTKESLPNTHPLWSTLVYEDFTSVFESKLVADESQDYYDRFFSLLERLFQSIPLAKPLVEAKRIAFRTEVKEVLHLVTNTTSSSIPRQVLGGILPKLSNFIYAREMTLEKCRKSLIANKQLIISGMAGIGKTSIGLTLIEKMNFETIWYIDTKDSEVELVGIYKRILCDDLKIQMDDEKEMDVPGRLETILLNEAKCTTKSLLIVFENVDNDALRTKIEDVFFSNISDKVSVMMLTRCQDLASTNYVVKIPLLDDEDAIQLLFHYSSKESYQEPLRDETLKRCKESLTKLNEIDYTILKNLALVLLEKLPLAITLVGSAKREVFKDSWKDLEAKWLDLIMQKNNKKYGLASSPSDPRKLVAPSIQLSIDHLSDEEKAVLQAISFWGSRGTNIPLAWVGDVEGSQLFDFTSLKRLNLVQELVLGEQSRLSCHSLVAELVWIGLTPTEQIKVATQCIQFALDEDSNKFSIENRQQRVNCLNSLVIEKTRILDVFSNDNSFSSLLKRYGNIAYDSGMYRAGIPIYQLALEMDKQVYGPENEETAKTLNNLARLLSDQGKYDEAIPFFEQSIAIFRKALGEDHPNVATLLNNLAVLLEEGFGNYEESEKLKRQAIAIWKKALGEDHPQVATGLNNLALLLKTQGKFEEARPLYDQSLAIRRKVLGEDHPDVAQSLNNLAVLLKAQGKYDEAKPLMEQVLASDLKTLGPDHPNVAMDLNNLATLLSDQGKFTEAELLYQESLAIRKKVLGEDHPDVAQSLNNLAFLLSDQGKYDEARKLGKQAYASALKSLGKDHPDVINTYKYWETF